jgi:hypothetical protein
MKFNSVLAVVLLSFIVSAGMILALGLIPR